MPRDYISYQLGHAPVGAPCHQSADMLCPSGRMVYCLTRPIEPPLEGNAILAQIVQHAGKSTPFPQLLRRIGESVMPAAALWASKLAAALGR
jgi:hypothetical protein